MSPSASASGTGSFANPWRLQTALNQPAALNPGDTIWLRGGTYSGTFSSSLTGTAASPIVVRRYPGERAILDGGNSGGVAILSVAGAYTWYWGFEIMSSNTIRQATSDGSNPPNIVRGEGITINQSSATGSGLKFINLVIHDARQGLALWKEAVDAEAYGCLLYYNGWEGATDRGHGHGIYSQNQTGTKRLTDNIIFSGFGHGIHVYGSSAAFLDNFLVQGNTIFNSGNLSPSGPARVLLLGGDAPVRNPQVLGNFLYRQSNPPSSDFRMGYGGGCVNPIVTGNYVATTTYFAGCTSGLTMTGNTFYGGITGFSPSAFPSNTYYSSRPTGVRVFLRPNLYEPGRANITIYNWDLIPNVNVDLSSVLPTGSQYEIRNAQNFFAPPVLSGTYSGGTVSLPMTGLSTATPVGWPAPIPSGPEFNVFIVIQTAPPPPAPTSFYTVTPCRVVDTRRPNGPLGGPAIAANSDRAFPLAGQCGIPMTAKAVVINLTATQATAAGDLRLYPGGSVVPLTSSLNYRAAKARANTAIAQLGTSGSLGTHCTQPSGTVHLIIDVNGYFQ